MATRSRRIVICLCPGFSLFSLGCALDVLRHANRFAGADYYRWRILGENDREVEDGNGIAILPTAALAAVRTVDFAFLLAGFDSARFARTGLCDWIARQANRGAVIGGISNGAFPLAARGLLDDHLATTHWEDFESFCELFPRVKARYQRCVFDRGRITCSGGSATLDLFIELVRQDLGNEISLKIERQMLLQEQSATMPGSLARQVSMQLCSATTQTALNLIEAGLGQSISVAELASRVGVSRRELLRRFRRELNSTPSRVLANRRLDRARSLIMNTRLPIAQIAESVGFSSQSHLTTRYRGRFGVTPAQQRRDYAAASERLPLTRRDARDW